jgi:uncharacterized membrane protein YbhN (UPF0104 family)
VKRSAALVSAIVVSLACLFALYRSDHLHWGTLAPIFSEHAPLLVGCACCQVLVTFVATWRYRLLLRELGVELPFRRIVGPTLVGQAIGVWLPASMAVMEAVRLGLMLGVTRGDSGMNNADVRARVVIASLLDRLVGQAAMLLLGGVLGFALSVDGGSLVKLPRVLLAMSAISAAGGACLLLLPALGSGRTLARLLERLRARRTSTPSGALARAAALCERLMTGVALLRARRHWFVAPGLLSCGILLLAGLTLYLPGLATAVPPAYLAFVVGIPLLSLSQLLPLGFAGLGSQQLLTVGMLAPFAVDDASVAAASFVQNAVSLATTTLLGAFASAFLGRDLAVLRRASG